MTWLTWVSARPDGELFAVGDSSGRLRVWCPAEHRVVARRELGSHVRRAEWTRDGAYLLAIGEDDTLHVLSADGATAVASIATGHRSTYGLSVHPSRRLACTTGTDGHVRTWDIAAQKLVRDVEERSAGSVTAMSETHFAAGFRDGSFAAWAIDGDGPSLAGGGSFASYVAAMCFSTNGAFLVLAGGAGSTIAIRTETWVADEVWKSHPPKPIATNSIQFDGFRFLCAHSDDTASIFDGVGDRAPKSLGHPFYVDRKPWEQAYIVSSACFVPGAKLVLTSHFTGRLRVWQDNLLGRKVADIAFDENDIPVFVGGGIDDPAAWWATQTGKPARVAPKQAERPRDEGVPRTCAVCGASVRVPKRPPPELLPPLSEYFSSFDGRPCYDVERSESRSSNAGVALDIGILARSLGLETCSQCGHVAPALDATSPQIEALRDASVRDELLALPEHHELARRFLYVAFLHHGSDPLEEARWALRAAWADDGAGLDARARFVRKRAGVLFDDAIAKGAWPDEDHAIAHALVADVFRRAGDFARAAAHCKAGLVPGVSNHHTRRKVMCEALFVVDARTDALTNGHASHEVTFAASGAREAEIHQKLAELVSPAPKPKPKAEPIVVGAPDRRVRSITEAKFFAAVHGCRGCGAPLLSLFPDRKGETFVLRGGCPTCETLNVFHFFAEPTTHVTVVKGREIGDATPTRIFSPAELFAAFARIRDETKSDLSTLAPSEWDTNTGRRDRAITCANELLKMIPPGAAAIPDLPNATRAWLEAERKRLAAIPPPEDDGAGLPPHAARNDLGALLDRRGERRGPPTVGEVEAALGVRLDPAKLGACASGRLSVDSTSPMVPFWSAAFDAAAPPTSLAALRARPVTEWSATFLTGIDDFESALRGRFGPPRVQDDDRIYGEAWIVSPRGGAGGFQLTFFTSLPEWARGAHPTR